MTVFAFRKNIFSFTRLCLFFALLCTSAFLSAQTATAWDWTGGTDTSWTEPGNWTSTPASGAYPQTAADNVTIPDLGIAANYPVINTSVTIGNLTVSSGAKLTVNAQLTAATLTIGTVMTPADLTVNSTTISVTNFIITNGNIVLDSATVETNGFGITLGEIKAAPGVSQIKITATGTTPLANIACDTGASLHIEAAGTALVGTPASTATGTLSIKADTITFGAPVNFETIILEAATAGSSSAGSSLTANSLLLKGGAGFDLKGSVATLAADTTGPVTLENSSALSAGSVTSVLPAATVTGISTNGGNLSLQTTAGNITITQPVNTGAGPAVFNSAGNIVINGAVTSTGAVTLQAAGSVTQTAAITASALLLQGMGPFSLTGANTVSTLAANTALATLNFTNTAALSIGTAAGHSGIAAGNITITAPSISVGAGGITSPGTVTLTGSVTQTAGITADALLLRGTGPFTLTGTNTVSTLAADAAGAAVSFTNTAALSIGTAAAHSGIAAGNVTITAPSISVGTGGITGTNGIKLTAGIGDITLNGEIRTNTNTVQLDAGGEITGTAAAVRITANQLEINARNGNAGTAADPLYTAVNRVSAVTATGSVCLQNDRSITVTAVNGSGDISVATTAGALTVDGLIQTAANRKINLTAVQDIVLDTAASLQASGGTISLTSDIGAVTILSTSSVLNASAIAIDSFNAINIMRSFTGNPTLALRSRNGNVSVSSNNTSFTIGTADTLSGIAATGTVSLTNGTASLTINDSISETDLDDYDITAPGGFTQTGTGTVNLQGDIQTTNNDIRFSAPVVQTGGVRLNSGTGAGDITLSESLTTNGTRRQIFFNAGTGTVTVQEVGGSGAGDMFDRFVVENGEDVTVNGNLYVADECRIGATSPVQDVTVTGTVNCNGDDNGGVSGTFILVNGRAISLNSVTAGNNAHVEIQNTGTLTARAPISAAKGFTQTGTGSVRLGGNISATNSAISIAGNVTLDTGITLNTGTGGGNITLTAGVTGAANNLTLTAGTGSISVPAAATGLNQLTASGRNITFGDTINTTNAINLTATGGVTVTGAIACTNALTVTSGNNVSFGSTTAADTVSVKVQGNYFKAAGPITAAGGFTKSGSGKSMLGGGITVTASGTITLNTETYVYNGGANSVFSVPAGTIDIPADLHIAAPGSTITFSNPLSADNIALYAGTVHITGSLSARSDLVVMGAGYGINDTDTGIANLFAYNNPGRPGFTAAPSMTLATAFPDATAIPAAGGVFGNLGGKELHAGKNFYANGINLNPAAAWELYIPDNSDPLSAFAEAYNLTAANCTVIGPTPVSFAWVSAAENVTDGTGNTNWAFSRPEIADSTPGSRGSGTYTVFDDVIRIEFNRPIENTNNDISRAVSRITLGGTAAAFTGTFTDPECTQTTDGKGNLTSFYLKAGQTWNTDATGASAGGAGSTDRTGAHRTIAASVSIPKALTGVFATLRDIYKNRIATVAYTNTQDRCRPVLYAVYTGQAVRSAADAWDSHNFVELRYSEPVNIGGLTADAYTRSQADFSAAGRYGGAEQSSGSTLSFPGYFEGASGKLETGVRRDGLWTDPETGADRNTANALYQDTAGQVLRIYIAGYMPGQRPLPDGTNANFYPGYITDSTTPSGTVSVPANDFITDAAGNTIEPSVWQPVSNSIQYGATDRARKPVIRNTVAGPDYGPWDTSPPSMTPLRMVNGWTAPRTDFGIVGVDTGGLPDMVDTFELHFFDNTYDYKASDTFKWVSKRGWLKNNADIPNSIPDTFGGSRPDAAAKTTGGIRSTSLLMPGTNFPFSYSLAGTSVQKTFGTSFKTSVTLKAFFAGNPSYTGTIGGTDGLYLSFTPASPNTDRVRDTYDVVYDEAAGYVTDLAGNRLRADKWRSIDRTPPKFQMTVTPLNDKQLFILFSKKLDISPANLVEIPKQIEVRDINADTVQPGIIDDGVPAKPVIRTEAVTGMTISLSRSMSVDELVGYKLVIKDPGLTGTDPITGQPADVTAIIDTVGNWMEKGSQFPISVFGINVVTALYASDGLVDPNYGQNEGALRTFDGTGRLSSGREILFSVKVDTGGIGTADPLTMYADIAPPAASVSRTWNENTGKNLRVWLPEPFAAISPVGDSAAIAQTLTAGGSGDIRNFRIAENFPKGRPKTGGEELDMLFRYGNYKIYLPDPATGNVTTASPILPFYCLRLSNPSDITSLDMWHISIADIIQQRGGVSVLNNVINPLKQEHAVIEIDMPKTGQLTVQILTLDGNVVKVLHKGRTSEGQHYYRWDGTNTGGRAVARGMYFVRVSGPNMDETRKIMVVKE